MWKPHVSPLPPSGICPAAATVSTPGSARRRATISSVFADTTSSFAYAWPTIELPLSELRSLNGSFGADVADIFDLPKALAKRKLTGAPSLREVRKQLARWRKTLAANGAR